MYKARAGSEFIHSILGSSKQKPMPACVVDVYTVLFCYCREPTIKTLSYNEYSVQSRDVHGTT